MSFVAETKSKASTTTPPLLAQQSRPQHQPPVSLDEPRDKAVQEQEPISRQPGFLTRTARKLGTLVMTLGRLFILVALCGHQLTSIFAVGWTFRLMRRRILAGWHRRSEDLNKPTLEEYLARIDPEGPPAARRLPRLFVSERKGQGWLRSLRRNVGWGFVALLCVFAFTLPGEILMWFGWELGWLVSFNKFYEQAFLGRTVFFTGMALFVAAMCYVPMAWGHMAASGDPRAFFQFKLIGRLVRRTPGKNLLFAVGFGLFFLAVSIARLVPMFWGNSMDAEEMTAEQIAYWRNMFNLYTAFVAFIGFVCVHLLAARMYRKAILDLAKRDPSIADQLPTSVRHALETLDLIPVDRRRQHPVVALAISTGRISAAAWLWPTLIVAWFIVVFLIPLATFFNYNFSHNWINQPLVDLPSLNQFPWGAPQP